MIKHEELFNQVFPKETPKERPKRYYCKVCEFERVVKRDDGTYFCLKCQHEIDQPNL
jgi:ribosomal protein L37AE/L43A